MRSALVWFRRDLRCHDHAALYHALRDFDRVYCVFVFDTAILDALDDHADRRVAFIHAALEELDQGLDTLSRQAGGQGAGIIVRHARADEAVPELAAALGVKAVFANRDYEPSARARDDRVASRLRALGIGYESFKDIVIFEEDEVLTASARPYSVFTPYRNAWMKALRADHYASWPVERHANALAPRSTDGVLPDLPAIGFSPVDLRVLGIATGMSGGRALRDDFLKRMGDYGDARDYPAVKGVSYLSAHLRFGTVSIRELVAAAHQSLVHSADEGARAWLNELIWRDFYHMILWHHPHVVERSFKPAFDRVRWVRDEELLAAWCEGRTGYPLVDAGMRQLAYSGYMHNRLRMVTASFLTKDLGIDRRLGEAWFARKLIDFDLAANNGGWQWAASTGCDAQPWFRIFNPVTQSERFDPEGRFIRRYVPELEGVPMKRLHAPWTMGRLEQQAAGVIVGRDYPAPIVDHAEARRRTLQRFEVVRGGESSSSGL